MATFTILIRFQPSSFPDLRVCIPKIRSARCARRSDTVRVTHTAVSALTRARIPTSRVPPLPALSTSRRRPHDMSHVCVAGCALALRSPHVRVSVAFDFLRVGVGIPTDRAGYARREMVYKGSILYYAGSGSQCLMFPDPMCCVWGESEWAGVSEVGQYVWSHTHP